MNKLNWVLEHKDKYEDFELLMYNIVFHCAPALTGKKVSSLVTFKDADKKINSIWKLNKDKIKDKMNIQFIELKETDLSTVVLFYNENMLESILIKNETKEFLLNFGYGNFVASEALSLLKKRYEKACPHEIGIFLGYPINDVKCFLDCNKHECLAIGYWKVFSDIEGALETFALYDSAKKLYRSFLSQGYKPSQVALKHNIVHNILPLDHQYAI